MKKIFATLGTLMIALSILGFVYADWTQTIYIDGTVETGEYCVGFTYCDCTCTQTKPVATCDCDLQDWKGTHDATDCYETVVITIDNAYPQLVIDCDIEICNCGDIPAVVTDVNFVAPLPAWWVDITVTNSPVGEQLDPCDCWMMDLHIEIIQEDPANGECPMDAFTEFHIEIETIQWNKY